MSSRIEELIDEIEDYFDECPVKMFSKSEIIVNRDNIEELLSELRARTPEEIKRYQKIISNKEAIIADARAKAEALINEATAHTNQLINEHEIMQEAYQRASEIVTMATAQGQEILDNAMMEANEARMSAAQYMDDVLEHLDNIISSSIASAAANYEALIGDLSHYKEIIVSNRNQLHPDEEEVDETVAEYEGTDTFEDSEEE